MYFRNIDPLSFLEWFSQWIKIELNGVWTLEFDWFQFSPTSDFTQKAIRKIKAKQTPHCDPGGSLNLNTATMIRGMSSKLRINLLKHGFQNLPSGENFIYHVISWLKIWNSLDENWSITKMFLVWIFTSHLAVTLTISMINTLFVTKRDNLGFSFESHLYHQGRVTNHLILTKQILWYLKIYEIFYLKYNISYIFEIKFFFNFCRSIEQSFKDKMAQMDVVMKRAREINEQYETKCKNLNQI